MESTSASECNICSAILSKSQSIVSHAVMILYKVYYDDLTCLINGLYIPVLKWNEQTLKKTSVCSLERTKQ